MEGGGRVGDTPRCDRCRFWDTSEFTPPSEYGHCRRFPPPTVTVGEHPWPVTAEDDWCGEFRPTGGTEPDSRTTPDVDIRHIMLSTRAYNALRRAGTAVGVDIKNLRDVARLSWADIEAVDSCGAGTIREIRRRLDPYGVRLRGEAP